MPGPQSHSTKPCQTFCRVILKFTPQLHFKLDVAVERGSRVIDILTNLDIPEDEPLGEEQEDDENPHASR